MAVEQVERYLKQVKRQLDDVVRVGGTMVRAK